MVRGVYFDSGVKKGPWNQEEDALLMAHVQEFGPKNWRLVPILAGLTRCGKSCRLRWVNYLSPDLQHGSFTQEEEDLIIQLQAQLGNRWAAMASKLPGRTDHAIKNHWHAHLKNRIATNSDNQKYPETNSSSGSSSSSCVTVTAIADGFFAKYPTVDANEDVQACFINQVHHGQQLDEDLESFLQDLNNPTYSNSDSAAPMFLSPRPWYHNPIEQSFPSAENPRDSMGFRVGQGDLDQVINFESTDFNGFSSDTCWITSSPAAQPQPSFISLSPDQSNESWGIHISNNILHQLSSSDLLTPMNVDDQNLHSAYAFGEDELLYNVVH